MNAPSSIKIYDAVVAALFVLAAAVQLNDPDPLVWFVVYGAVALVAGLAFFGRFFELLIGFTLGACLLGLIYTAPGFYRFLFIQEGHTLMEQMSEDAPFVEQSREFLGLLIASGVLIAYAVRARRARQRARESEAF